MPRLPFSTESIELGAAQLVALDPSACERLASAIAAMAPWSVMGYSAAALAGSLGTPDTNAHRFAVMAGDAEAGVISIRYPWLRGPYLELMALFPEAQGRAIGSRILEWIEEEAVKAKARNLFVCAASFNTRALSFYRRHGFQPVASLPALVADGYEEILLRKFPIGTSA